MPIIVVSDSPRHQQRTEFLVPVFPAFRCQVFRCLDVARVGAATTPSRLMLGNVLRIAAYCAASLRGISCVEVGCRVELGVAALRGVGPDAALHLRAGNGEDGADLDCGEHNWRADQTVLRGR
jgi:hypothetical protein